jgi:hypothetical protein|tara:strand:- start:1239 stop:1559 length:321 start_codon:yes stop_codon:yes gene_type:complete
MQNQTKKQLALKVQEAAGDRYATLLRYESVCKFLAWFTMIVGFICSIIFMVNAISHGRGEYFPMAIGSLIGSVFSFFSLMVTANMIRAFVDIAVNSFVSVELQKFD